MTRRLVSHDPVRGVSTYVDMDPDGSFLFTQVQNVRGLQTRITEQANDWQPGQMIGDTQRHVAKVAEIPAIIVNRLIQQGIWHDDKKMRAWLNDRDNRSFRTSGGRV